VKVLDFGLAKALVGDHVEVNLSQSPTLSQAATQQGIILGTAAYMSPEQARGKEVDKRTDIWAFGVVLFEMLTGRSLFSGEDVSSTLARVLERAPDFSVLPQNLHARIQLLLERCLKKDPKNRYSGISDARVDIQEVLADPKGVFVQPTALEETKRKWRQALPWVATAIVLTAIIAGIAGWILKPTPLPETKKVVRFDFDLPDPPVQQDDQPLKLIGRILLNLSLAVSPEGGHVVYYTPEGLYMRYLDKLDVSLIDGTDGNSTQPFFSPEGDWLGYWDTEENKLMKIYITGGVPIHICDAQRINSPRWNENDTITYVDLRQGIMQVSADGGTPEPLIEAAGAAILTAQVLPNGKAVLYSQLQNDGPMIILVHSLESGETKELFEGQNPQYLPTGHLVYSLGSVYYAVQFDLDSLDKIG